jgi:CHAD domain-containing protein
VAEVQREVETKFDIPPDFDMPDLLGFAGEGGREDVDTVQLASTYLDTTAHDLMRFRMTLRRRAGDADTGWQLKVPGTGERTELRWAPTAGIEDLPDEVHGLLRPFVGDEPIRPIARLEVSRTRHRIYRADGALIAEVARDDVRAVDLGGGVRASRWHEVEVELGRAGDRKLAGRVAPLLGKAGAVSSTSRSKLSRALLGIGNEGVGTPRTSSGAVLIDYMSAQSDAIVAGHFAIQRDADESVHRTRVALRRLRSTVRSFVDFFDAAQAREFDAELAWYAGVLSPVRDIEVMRLRINAAIAELPADLVVGPVAKHIADQLDQDQTEHRATLLVTLRSPRYAALLGEIARWRDDPPFSAAAGRPAHTLTETLERLEKSLGKRLRAATTTGGTDEDMHRARKLGKRTRYAAEATGEPVGTDLTGLQNLLGEYQDSVVAQHLLRRLANDAWSRGEDAFTYGVLVANERQIVEQIRREARPDATR